MLPHGTAWRTTFEHCGAHVSVCGDRLLQFEFAAFLIGPKHPICPACDILSNSSPSCFQTFNSQRKWFLSRGRFVRRGLTSETAQSAAAMAKLVDQLPVTIERLERALVLLAYFIELDGDVHLPMYEKFEAELAELKTKEAIKYRARKRLESYLNEGGSLKAIR